MRAKLFKDIINDSDDEEDGKAGKRGHKKITPNYKIESVQYEGGYRSDDGIYEGGDGDGDDYI